MAVRNFLDKDGLELYDELIKQKIDEVRASNFTAEDKEKFDGISEEANKVSYTQTLTSGTKIGELSIDDNSPINLYAPNPTSESDIAGMGFTKNVGTITGITMNGASIGTSGNVNLGNFATVATSGDYNDLVNTPNIMSADDIDEIIDQLPTVDELVFDDELSSMSENAVQNKVVTAALDNKVDKNGTDSLMTAAEHTKLAGIATGAEVNVQADWNVTDSTSDAFIKNKPTIPAAQVNSDWNASSGKAQILNKPTLGTAAAKNVPSSGNAASGEVVMGNDSRLTDSRTPKSHTHTKSEITDFPTALSSFTEDSTHRLVTDTEKNNWNAKTSNTGTVTKVSTGAGLTGGDVTTTGTIKANLKSETNSTLEAADKGSTSGREYAVGLDKNGKLSVNVPWTDNNTTYTAATAAPGNVASASSTGTSTNYARQDHTHGISLATGDNNGQVKIAGTNVSVKGLGSAAYTNSTAYIAASAKGANSGVAELDANGKVPTSQLPAYVDDVLEYSAKANFPTTGETGKIYVDTTTNLTYRWSGTAYVEISPSLALGETSSTAYRGDRGKIAYDHSQSTHARTDATKTEASSTNGNIKINGTETTVYTHPGSGTNPHGTTKSDVGLGNVGNFKAVSTVASQGLTNTEKANARANIGAGTSSFSGSYNDLTNKPTIPTVNNATLTIQKNGTNVQTFTANQSTNATANITVPTKTSELTNDSGYITNAGVTGVKGNSETNYRTGNVNITAANIGLGNVGNFKAVSTVASQGLTDTEKSNARANIGAGTSSFSGNYNDLSNKPTIPTVNNATLTIQKNGTNVQTFTANQASNATANITVPTKVSELTNDSGFTTNTGTITGIKMNGASKGASGVVDLGTVITAHQDISGKVNKSGDTMTGALNFANATANKVGDDAQIGDFNRAGSLGVQGINGNTAITLIKNGTTFAASSESCSMVYNSTNKCIDFVFT